MSEPLTICGACGTELVNGRCPKCGDGGFEMLGLALVLLAFALLTSCHPGCCPMTIETRHIPSQDAGPQPLVKVTDRFIEVREAKAICINDRWFMPAYPPLGAMLALQWEAAK